MGVVPGLNTYVLQELVGLLANYDTATVVIAEKSFFQLVFRPVQKIAGILANYDIIASFSLFYW